jgi:hypothetical protein
LGAHAPGVKGLKAVSFAEVEEGVVTFGELPGYAGISIARLFGQLRDWLIADKGQDVADRVLPGYDVEYLRSMGQRADEAVDADDATQIQGGTPALSFAEPGNAATLIPTQEKTQMKTAQELQAELDASNTELATLRAADAKRAADTRHAGHVSFAEGLVAAAKWPAAARDVLVATLDHLALPEGVVSFGEGDAAKPLATVLQEQLTALPPSVSFGEFAKKGGASAGTLTNQQVADRAATYQARRAAAGQNITLSDAIDAVNAGTDQA